MGLARRYNTGKLRWSLVDWKAISSMVRVLMYGAHKYSVFRNQAGDIITGAEISPEAAAKLEVESTGAQNWRKGLKVTETCDSLQRHLLSYLEGEDIDPESGESHMGHIMCNAMFLEWLRHNRPDLDDRFNSTKSIEE